MACRNGTLSWLKWHKLGLINARSLTTGALMLVSLGYIMIKKDLIQLMKSKIAFD